MTGYFTEMPTLYCARCGHTALVLGNGKPQEPLSVWCVNLKCEQVDTRYGYRPKVAELAEEEKE